MNQPKEQSTSIGTEQDDPEYQYRDVLDALSAQGYDAGIADTGGGCLAIEISLGNDRRILVTDKDELLADIRIDHNGWAIGLYAEDDSDPIRFETTDDGSATGLITALGGFRPAIEVG